MSARFVKGGVQGFVQRPTRRIDAPHGALARRSGNSRGGNAELARRGLLGSDALAVTQPCDRDPQRIRESSERRILEVKLSALALANGSLVFAASANSS